ncbi:MAG: exo-beta-N-acetylmuramidase NamZ family protein [Candidatus Acidiferrales bacterium]
MPQPRRGLAGKFVVSVCFAFALCFSAHASVKHSRRARRVGRVQTGLDVLEAEKFAPLRGKHVGLITNHTGLDALGRSTIERLFHAPGVQLVALFSPEHGISGSADEKVSSSKDPTTGLPTYSLYGESLRPTDEMLSGIDTLVFDIQDAGVRFYTYTTTMAYAMEEAAKHHIAFYVLDRPDLLGGDIIEGPMLDPDKTNFVGYYPLPIRYALTIGELAQFFNGENHIGCDLHVIAMKNWHRNYFFESTGIRWVPPSPNLRTIKGSMLYPGIEILQNAGVSVGRGTQAPFEEFGAPWIDGAEVAAQLNALHLPGLRFADQPFIPVSGLYAGQRCGGVGIRITDRAAVRSVRASLEIAVILQKLYPAQFKFEKLLVLMGNAETIRQLEAGVAPEQIVESWSAALAKYDETRRKYFLYK